MNEDNARALARKFSRDFTRWVQTDTNIDFWCENSAEDELEERVRRLLLGTGSDQRL